MLGEGLIGKITKIATAPGDKVKVEVTLAEADAPEDVFTWRHKYVIVKKQSQVETPIEKEAKKNKKQKETQGVNPPEPPTETTVHHVIHVEDGEGKKARPGAIVDVEFGPAISPAPEPTAIGPAPGAFTGK